ncbi:MAG TPA: hypothetical protein ENK55_03850 [Actinobacteria bacterium]|nr:hypothetical protein [Actinomycetota bacterium]
MRVLVATSGALDPGPTVALTGRLLVGGGTVTVMTAVQIAPGFRDELEDDDPNTQGADRELRRYVEERAARATERLVCAFEAAGYPTELRVVTDVEPTEAIRTVADDVEADVVVVGATRPLFDQGAWESVSARLVTTCTRPILVIPAGALGRSAD